MPRLFTKMMTLCCASMLAGCITHRVDVVPTSPSKNGEGELSISGTPTQVIPPLPAAQQRHSSLPIELAADGWWRDDQGLLYRTCSVTRTDRPWWQRFPADAATDLWPGDIDVATTAAIDFQPVIVRTAADLNREAAAAGYASATTPSVNSSQGLMK